jgi:hypothetical protein
LATSAEQSLSTCVGPYHLLMVSIWITVFNG